MASYDEDFFRHQMTGSRRSAERIVRIATELLSPASVVDVGCGVGTWLAEFRAQGAQEIRGFDGDYVDRSLLQIPPEAFTPADLEQPLPQTRRYDLAISMEVAEHLSPERGPSLVRDLTGLAPAVLFSAAVPHQGGTDHVNERWQDYWAGLFEANGYAVRDCVRPRIWDDAQVEPWYAQNALLYTAPEVELATGGAMPLRVVHPRILERQTTGPISVRDFGRRSRPVVVEAVKRPLRPAKRALLDRARR